MWILSQNYTFQKQWTRELQFHRNFCYFLFCFVSLYLSSHLIWWPKQFAMCINIYNKHNKCNLQFNPKPKRKVLIALKLCFILIFNFYVFLLNKAMKFFFLKTSAKNCFTKRKHLCKWNIRWANVIFVGYFFAFDKRGRLGYKKEEFRFILEKTENLLLPIQHLGSIVIISHQLNNPKFF